MGSFCTRRPQREVTSVAVNSAGIIYAAAVGTKSGSPCQFAQQPFHPDADRRRSSSDRSTARRQAPRSRWPRLRRRSSQSILGGSEVYRIGTDNFPQRIWQHAQDIVYALGFDSQGRPIRRDGQQRQYI